MLIDYIMTACFLMIATLSLAMVLPDHWKSTILLLFGAMIVGFMAFLIVVFKVQKIAPFTRTEVSDGDEVNYERIP